MPAFDPRARSMASPARSPRLPSCGVRRCPGTPCASTVSDTPPCVGDLGQHVNPGTAARWKSPSPGRPRRCRSPAVEVYAYGDLRFARFARHKRPAVPAADVSAISAHESVMSAHAFRPASSSILRPSAAGAKGCPSPRGCAPAGCRSPVADDVARPEGRTTRPCSGRTCPYGVCASGHRRFERAVDEHVVERDAFACDAAQHFFVRRPEILLREGLRAQPVLVRRHHQLEIQPPERPERRDRTGYEFRFSRLSTW